MPSHTNERYAQKAPDFSTQEGGDLLVNDTGGDLRIGDIVQIRGDNATSGVSKTVSVGKESWLFRASLPESDNNRFKYGKFRIVTKDAAAGAETRVAGRMTTKAMVLITASAGTTINADSPVIAVDGAKGGTVTLAGVGTKIIARTLEEVTVATGESAVLALCEINGEEGFGYVTA